MAYFYGDELNFIEKKIALVWCFQYDFWQEKMKNWNFLFDICCFGMSKKCFWAKVFLIRLFLLSECLNLALFSSNNVKMSLCLESAHSRSEILQDELKHLSRQHEEEIKKLIDENEKKIQGITLKASHERSECEYTTKRIEAIIWRGNN